MKKITRIDAPYEFKEFYSKYPQGHTIFEAILDWLETLNNVIEDQNELKQIIVDFIASFEGDLQNTIIQTLEEWEIDGKLADIINQALFESKADKTYVDDQLDLKSDKTYVDDQLGLKSDKTYVDGEISLIKQLGVNVKSYGAIGDGVADDTEAIKNALLDNDDVMLPAGVYNISDTIVLKSGKSLLGVGDKRRQVHGGVVIKWISTYSKKKTMVQLGENIVEGAFTDGASNIVLKNIVLDGSDNIGFGIYGTYVTNETIIKNVTSQHCTEYGMYFAKSWYGTFEDLTVRHNRNIGISFGRKISYLNGEVVDPDTNYQMNGCFINNIRSHYNGSYYYEENPNTFTTAMVPTGSGIVIGEGYSFNFTNWLSETNGGVGIYIEPEKLPNMLISKGYLENNCRNSGLDVSTDLVSMYIKSVSDVGGPIIIEDIYISYNSGGGVELSGGDSRAIYWENIHQPRFLIATDEQLEKMIFNNVYYSFTRYNTNPLTESFIVSHKIETDKSGNYTIRYRHGTTRFYIKKISGTLPSSLGFRLTDGTTTSRSIPSLDVGELLSWITLNNVEEIYLPNTSSGVMVIEAYDVKSLKY